jgi:DNA-directed RNA polymerase subunit beta
MTQVFSPNEWFRKTFSNTPVVLDTPPLMKLQVNSYEEFLQKDVPPAKRIDVGLQQVFKSVFPIYDFNKTVSLEFVSYSLEEPKYTVKECRQRGLSYEAPLKVVVRLVFFDVTVDRDGAEQRTVSSVKEQEVYLGNIPLMAETGSFVYNGTERVIVSQLHRSPGIIFEHDNGKKHSSGKLLYSARIIPHRGSWLDFEFDHKNILFARIDRKRKLHASVVLKAMGYSTAELLNVFYQMETITFNKDATFSRRLDFNLMVGTRAAADIVDPKSGSVIVKKGKKYTKASVKKMEDSKIIELPAELDEVVGKVLAEDIFNEKTGEVICLANEALSESRIHDLMKAGVKEVKVLYIDMINFGDQIRNTLLIDKTETKEDALVKIFERLRPGEPPTLEASTVLFENLFFNKDKYDLSKVGRMKINYKFGMNIPVEETVLTRKDILTTVQYLVELNNGKGKVDDIDHLGNRRVRAVGELLENQFRVGLVRMERAVKERMAIQEIETMMPYDLVNQKPVAAAVKEFFGSSQLSQFMDQTNPLSEVTHKRRLSALGPGGLTRERAGFEVRDVHGTHYGRMCPVETPEGPNIGLITSLATYARVSEYGFIETPYQIINEDRTIQPPKYFSAFEEEGKVIAQVDAKYIDGKKIHGDQIAARSAGEFTIVSANEVQLMDVSPTQMISIATSLIPFLEHDDANRALMGSNMMRQAVPVVRTDAPIVGTGVEQIIARDSGAIVYAKESGRVIFVDSNRIVIQRDKFTEGESGVDVYKLTKYQRTNQNTCNNQKALVKEGDMVSKGMVIADGPATHLGDLALGQNVLVAFMPWGGYNYEDSILINENILARDVFTSVHIESFEIEARDTKLGKEEITRDIPNVSEEALKDLDEAGIIRVGAIIKPGDILVGKITPKGESQLSPEEKLLKAIFGDKAGDVKDTSLRVPSSVRGTVIDAKVYTREGVELDTRSKEIIDHETTLIRRDERIEIKAIQTSAIQKIAEMFKGAKTTDKLISEDGTTELLGKSITVSAEILSSIPFELIGYLPLEAALEEKLSEYFADVRNRITRVRQKANEEIAKLHKGDELPPGVIKKVMVYVAIKRKLQPGDKMAGRHGNKGVISNVVPAEDMPFLADGTPVEIVLNPLGVPSRMNIGQLLELHLGWAGRGLAEKIKTMMEEKAKISDLKDYIFKIYKTEDVKEWLKKASDERVIEVAEQLSTGVRFSTSVFDGASEDDIREMLELGDLDKSGKTTLFDGKTGDVFAEDVTVGAMYMLKLHHLVDEKIHARSTGPYSLVTQQPLGGKAQFGGQRLGEMEVWALEAYGAAYTLQEFLTVKSDDVIGRTRMYESIVKGEQVLEPGLPESFNVLIRELQALCLDIKLEENSEEESTFS